MYVSNYTYCTLFWRIITIYLKLFFGIAFVLLETIGYLMYSTFYCSLVTGSSAGGAVRLTSLSEWCRFNGGRSGKLKPAAASELRWPVAAACWCILATCCSDCSRAAECSCALRRNSATLDERCASVGGEVGASLVFEVSCCEWLWLCCCWW